VYRITIITLTYRPAEIIGANLATAAMMRLFRHIIQCQIGKNSRRTDKGRDAACEALKKLLKLTDEINVVWR